MAFFLRDLSLEMNGYLRARSVAAQDVLKVWIALRIPSYLVLILGERMLGLNSEASF